MKVLLGLRRKNPDISICNLLCTEKSRNALHEGGSYRDPSVLERSLAFRESSPPINSTVILFDDVITTGATFTACKSKILTAYPKLNFKGLFLARAISPEPDFSDFDDVKFDL